ncbi:hypothetical protein VSR68_24000 [Paraburkholderia phymatum]
MKIDVPECTTHLFDETPELREHVLVGFAYELEPVAGLDFSAKPGLI